MKDPSKLFRWTLLVTSLLTIALLLTAAFRENFLAEWYQIQLDYQDLLRDRATNDAGRELERNFRVELKQVSVPALGAVDRCVSCHNGIDDPRMTDVAVPHRVHSGDMLKSHPADRYGCTVCHQGQGAATNFNDAKAEDAFWDYPLLPREMTQATCLSCHDPAYLGSKAPEQVALLREGMRLYEEKSCAACHKIGGRGGVLGLALDNVGAKTKHQFILTNLRASHTTWNWHLAHFRDPGGLVAASQMKNPTVTEREALALTVYMLSLRQRDVPESYLAPDKIEEKYRALNRPPLSGEQAYRQFCFACHGNGSYGRWDTTFKRFIPAVRGTVAATATAEYLESQITNGRPGTQMPAWGPQAGGLKAAEIQSLVEYLKAGAPKELAAPSSMAPARGDAGRGRALFAQNCAGCHGPAGHAGVAPEISNPAFLAAASDAFIAATIRNGRRATAMPAFQKPGATGLSDADIADLIAHLRSLAPQRPQQSAEQRKEKSGRPQRSTGGMP